MERFIKGEIYIHVEPKDWPHVVRIAHIIGAKLGNDVHPRQAGYLLYIPQSNTVHVFDWLSNADKAKAVNVCDLDPLPAWPYGVHYLNGGLAIAILRNHNLLLSKLFDAGFAARRTEPRSMWLEYNAHRGGYIWFDAYKRVDRYTKSVPQYMRVVEASALVETKAGDSVVSVPSDKPGIEIKTDASKQPSRDLLVIANQGKTVNANYSFGNGFGFEATARCSPDDQYNFLTGAMLALIHLSSPATAVRALDLYYHSKPENNKIKPFGGEA